MDWFARFMNPPVEDDEEEVPTKLSVKEYAEMKGISKTTVLRNINKGILKAEKNEKGVWEIEC